MRIRSAALAVTIALMAAACGNSSGGSSSSGGGQTDGITAAEVKVGGLIAETGPLGNTYTEMMKGVKAYFDLVNSQGGIFGRQLVVAKTRDDATNTTRNTAQARALVEEDHVFAVFASSPVFPGGTYLGQKGIPTFGTNFNVEWETSPSLFGHNGSFNDPKKPGPGLPWLAGHVGGHTAGIVAYTVAESADCAVGESNSFKAFGFKVGLVDNSLPFGASDVTADVQRMKDAHVDFVATCMDPTGNTLVYTGLKKAGLNNVKMYWPNGYDATTLKNYANQMEGVYFALQEVPFEAADKSPEMQLYMKQMAKVNPGDAVGEESLYGWVVADLFATGLRMVGPHPTRSALVNKLNTITHWTGEGLIPAVDWTKQHTASGDAGCSAGVQVQHGKFVPVFGTADSPFVCFGPNATTTNTVPAQKYSDVG